MSEQYQPRSEDVLAKTSHSSGEGKNFRHRTFQADWYDQYPWLTFCSTTNSVFCFVCRKAKQHGLLTFSARQKDLFVQSGFKNWKKALQRFKEHEASHAHRESTQKLRLVRQPSVANQLSTQLQTTQAMHRDLIEKELSSIRYLVRQGMALRGK